MADGAPPTGLWRQSSRVPEFGPGVHHAAALSMLTARRAMRGTLPPQFIHDPSLEMLLSLYLARPASMPAAELAGETTVPPVVAGHWIEALKAEGLLADEGGRIAMSEAGAAAMDTMLEAVIRSQREILGWCDH